MHSSTLRGVTTLVPVIHFENGAHLLAEDVKARATAFAQGDVTDFKSSDQLY